MCSSEIEIRKRILQDRIAEFEDLKISIENHEKAWTYGSDPSALIQKRIDLAKTELSAYEDRRD